LVSLFCQINVRDLNLVQVNKLKLQIFITKKIYFFKSSRKLMHVDQ